jgi:hypothetical protein
VIFTPNGRNSSKMNSPASSGSTGGNSCGRDRDADKAERVLDEISDPALHGPDWRRPPCKPKGVRTPAFVVPHLCGRGRGANDAERSTTDNRPPTTDNSSLFPFSISSTPPEGTTNNPPRRANANIARNHGCGGDWISRSLRNRRPARGRVRRRSTAGRARGGGP